MTSLTTAGGLISFSTAEVAPIADLGIFGSLGVLLSLLYTIVLLPPLLALIPIKTEHVKKLGQKTILMDRVMNGVGHFAIAHARGILVFTAIALVISLFGASRIHFSHDVLKWFSKTSEIRQASETIDQELRGSVTCEAIIDTGEENGLYEPEMMNRIDESSRYFETLTNGKVFVGKVIGLPIMLKEINKALHENQQEFYTIPQNRELIAQEFLLFEMSGSDDLEDVVDSQFSKTRLTLKMPFTDAVAYESLIGKIEEHFQKNYQMSRSASPAWWRCSSKPFST